MMTKLKFKLNRYLVYFVNKILFIFFLHINREQFHNYRIIAQQTHTDLLRFIDHPLI